MDLSGGVGMEKRHGGDWAGFEREYGTLPLDFSVSVSPLGLPRGVRDAVIRSLDETWRYPDPLCRSLREKLATVYGLDAESIVCGNGAADLIYRLTQLLHPRQALITVPGFGEYRAALEAAGCELVRVAVIDEDAAAAIAITPWAVGLGCIVFVDKH